MPRIRSTYDRPEFGPRKVAESFDAAIAAMRDARPDGHLEGSTGFAWSFLSRDNRGLIGTVWYSPRTDRYYYRVRPEGYVEW